MLEVIIPQTKVKELTLRDGARVFYRKWEGKREGDAIVYLHGLESHAGWFVEMGNILNRKGFHVYGIDRRGSGMNKENRGHMESYWDLIGDVKESIELARREHPGKKVFLLGLCWGCKLAVTFAAYNNGAIDKLVLVTPGIKTKADVPFKQKLDIIYSNYFQSRKLFDVPLDDTKFTRNPRYLDFIEKDDMKLKKVTARFFFETGKMNLFFDSLAHKIHLPVLVLLSGEDIVIDNEKTMEWFGKIKSSDKKVKVYEECPHALLFEETKAAINDIDGWLKQ